MTEAEIMKALECCRDNDKNLNMEKCFDECPYKGECAGKFMADSLDLINRKNAEIEILQKHNTEMAQKHYQDGRAEAIKEFAERVKKSRFIAEFLGEVVCVGYIDHIAKEMGVEL